MVVLCDICFHVLISDISLCFHKISSEDKSLHFRQTLLTLQRLMASRKENTWSMMSSCKYKTIFSVSASNSFCNSKTSVPWIEHTIEDTHTQWKCCCVITWLFHHSNNVELVSKIMSTKRTHKKWQATLEELEWYKYNLHQISGITFMTCQTSCTEVDNSRMCAVIKFGIKSTRW